MTMEQSLLVRFFEKATGTHAKPRTASAVARFGPYLVGMIAAKGLSTAGQLLVSRWLGPSQLGQLAVVIATSTLLASPIAAAWGNTFVRYAAGQPESTWIPLLRWSRRRAFFATTLVASVICLLSPLLGPALRVPPLLLICGAGLGAAMALWLFAKATCQGREDWRRFITTELAFGAVLTVVPGLLVLSVEPAWWIATLVFLAAYVAGAFPAWSLFRAQATVTDAAPRRPTFPSGAADYVRFALLTGAVNTIFLYSDRFAAQRVLGFAEVGVYQLYNFATIGVAIMLATMLNNFVFPLFPQGDRQAFAAIFRSGFLRLLPLTLAALFVAGWVQIRLSGFPFRPELLAIATISAAALIVSGFYGNLVTSFGVSGVQLTSRVAMATLATFAVGVVPAVVLGGLNGLFALYALINIGVATIYHRALRHLEADGAADASARPLVAAESVCAVVVAYHPDAELETRLRGLLQQVGAVIVVDNTPEGGCAERLRAMDERLEVVENRANLGVAAALNIGLSHALRIGCPWLLTLDQDTQSYPDMVDTLLHVLATCDPAPAVIGGNYLDPRRGGTEVSEEGGDWAKQITVITSGSLVDAALAQSIGGFREDYFIDQVDHEFCLRVRRHGHRVVISRKPVMVHSVGGPGGAYVPLLGVLPNHAPLRKYYITRNSLVTISHYWKQEPGWCARRFVRLMLGLGLMSLLEENPLVKIRAFAAGTVDALRQRMGPCGREGLHG